MSSNTGGGGGCECCDCCECCDYCDCCDQVIVKYVPAPARDAQEEAGAGAGVGRGGVGGGLTFITVFKRESLLPAARAGQIRGGGGESRRPQPPV